MEQEDEKTSMPNPSNLTAEKGIGLGISTLLSVYLLCFPNYAERVFLLEEFSVFVSIGMVALALFPIYYPLFDFTKDADYAFKFGLLSGFIILICVQSVIHIVGLPIVTFHSVVAGFRWTFTVLVLAIVSYWLAVLDKRLMAAASNLPGDDTAMIKIL